MKTRITCGFTRGGCNQGILQASRQFVGFADSNSSPHISQRREV